MDMLAPLFNDFISKKIGIVGYWATSTSTFRATDFVVKELKG